VTGVLEAMNNILHERQLEEYYCTLCYALFDLERHNVVLANSGLPYPVRCSGDDCGQIVLPGMPLGSFAGVTYDQVTFPTTAGDVYVFCTDGIFEAFNEEGVDFGTERLLEVVREARQLPASGIVDAIFDAVRGFRGDAPQNDDMTAVAVRIRDS